MCNIYRNANNEFYFSETKESRKDSVQEKNVSHEFAFNYCAKKNFGESFSNSDTKMPRRSKNIANKSTLDSRTKSIRKQNRALYLVCTDK